MSHVKTSQELEKAKVSTESEAVSGTSSDEWWKTYDRHWWSSKTWQAVKNAGCPSCGGTCVSSDTKRIRLRSGPVTSEFPIDAHASSLWPTATASDANASGAAGYSTDSGRHSGTTLTDAAVRLFPTPSASSYGSNRGGANGRTGPVRESFETMARNWSTPVRRDEKGPSGRLDLPAAVGQPMSGEVVLNPDWVETLMGFPIGWTDFPPVAAKRNSNGNRRGPSQGRRSSKAARSVEVIDEPD